MPADLHRSASAAPTAEERRLEVVPLMAGHYVTRRHLLPGRTIDDAVLIAVVAGRGWWRLGDGPRQPLVAGEVLCLPPRLHHAYGCDPAAGWEIRWVHFAGAYAESLARLAGFGPARAVIAIGDDPEPLAHLARIHELLASRTTWCQLDAAVALVALLVALKKRDTARLGEDARLIAAVEQGGGLAAMARAAGLSRFHFLRRFKRATGTTPWRYLLDLRLARAKSRLIDPACSVREAAAAAGFRDPAYFSRLFRQRTGRTPSAFRATHCPLPG